MVEGIVVGVDGTEGSMQALRWGVNVWNGPYKDQMAFVFHSPYFRRDRANRLGRAEVQLAETIDEVVGTKPSVRVDRFVISCDPADILCARSQNADLLVVGSRGHGGFARLLLGSVSSACAHRRRCPIVIVPGYRSDPSSLAGA